jgi:hypothetical protein
MPHRSDITITIPAEHYDALAAVVSAGLKHASINPLVRKELQAWWVAESELIGDAIEEGSHD